MSRLNYKCNICGGPIAVPGTHYACSFVGKDTNRFEVINAHMEKAIQSSKEILNKRVKHWNKDTNNIEQLKALFPDIEIISKKDEK